MFFNQQILTKNDCYRANRQIRIKGLMLHSTGANNPKLSRYVGPDDGLLGKNPNGNHWNQGGIAKCVHAFIGLDKNGDVRTYQTLPWAHRGWHAGGKANDTHIGVEICEDGLNDKLYFTKVYNEAVKLFAHLCHFYKLTEKDIIDHAEGRKLGIASNHGDVGHWFPKHGKSMNTFRADVKALLNVEQVKPPVEKPKEELYLKLSKPQAEELANVYAFARTKGIFSSDEHEKNIKAGTMTKDQAIFLNGLIAGAALNGGKRV